MYGMVNKALEELVTLRGCPRLWEEVKEEAGVDIDMFARNQGYPDDITYALLGAASHKLQLEPAQLLRDFGVHWVVHTAGEGYSEIMAAGGTTLGEFLVNLPNLHTRVSLLFPELKPPEFRCSDVTKGSMTFHYFSQRRGLTAFVEGLLEGLGQRFQTPIKITCSARRDEGADHDEFQLEWGEGPVA